MDYSYFSPSIWTNLFKVRNIYFFPISKVEMISLEKPIYNLLTNDYTLNS